jgi:hypothetical protein
VAFGRADLLAVHPAGTTSSGSVYLCDLWERCAALRLHGATGRVSVWARTPDRPTWTVQR